MIWLFNVKVGVGCYKFVIEFGDVSGFVDLLKWWSKVFFCCFLIVYSLDICYVCIGYILWLYEIVCGLYRVILKVLDWVVEVVVLW